MPLPPAVSSHPCPDPVTFSCHHSHTKHLRARVSQILQTQQPGQTSPDPGRLRVISDSPHPASQEPAREKSHLLLSLVATPLQTTANITPEPGEQSPRGLEMNPKQAQ